jgi:hypothetical protein
LQGDLCMPFQHDLGTPLQDSDFTAFAWFEHNSIHPPIQARGLRFWLGGEPATYCPQPPVVHCPPGKVTALGVGNSRSGLVCSVSFIYNIYIPHAVNFL